MIECFTSPPKDFKPKVEVSAIYVESNGAYLLLEIGGHKAEAGKWGVPCGKHEPSETPIAAAVRELYEESGIKANEEDLIPMGILYFRKPEIDYVYHAYYVRFDSAPRVQLSDEHQNFKWATIAQAKTMPLMNGAVEALNFIVKAN